MSNIIRLEARRADIDALSNRVEDALYELGEGFVLAELVGVVHCVLQKMILENIQKTYGDQ